MSHKLNNLNYNKIAYDLEQNGYVVIKDYINPNILANTNKTLMDNFDYDYEKKRKYAGFKMENLAINECYLHQKIYNELIDLIDFLKNRFNYSYITSGGNLNLPQSRGQKFHIDNKEGNLSINIPLIKVTKENGPLVIIGTHYQKLHTTASFMTNRLFRKKKILTTELGDIILRFSHTWHAGSANTTNIPRAVFNFSLRKNPYYKNLDDKKNLIENHKFVNEIGFNGNIYPNNHFGKLVELTDIFLPLISRMLQHSYNLIRNR